MAATEHPPEGLNATVERLDQLIALFNKKGMDLPAGLFDRTTQFLLNEAPYETLLGQSPTDPLILMLTRGPAGYRFIAKAVQHAVPDAVIQRGDLVWSADAATCQGDYSLSGHLRASGEPINVVFRAELSLSATGCIQKAAVIVDETWLGRLRDARHRP